MKIDIGCGNHKREGFIGVDIAPGEQVDYVIDIERDRLPFEDNSVTHVFSNHTFEHIRSPQNILREIVRVCEHNALVEIWTPYLKSNDAFLLGHFSFYNERIWEHICFVYDDFYFADAPGRFELVKYHYILYPGVLDSLERMGIPFAFALEHMFNIASEFGAFIRVDKTRLVAKKTQKPEIYVSYSKSGPAWKISDAWDSGLPKRDRLISRAKVIVQERGVMGLLFEVPSYVRWKLSHWRSRM